MSYVRQCAEGHRAEGNEDYCFTCGAQVSNVEVADVPIVRTIQAPTLLGTQVAQGTQWTSNYQGVQYVSDTRVGSGSAPVIPVSYGAAKPPKDILKIVRIVAGIIPLLFLASIVIDGVFGISTGRGRSVDSPTSIETTLDNTATANQGAWEPRSFDEILADADTSANIQISNESAPAGEAQRAVSELEYLHFENLAVGDVSGSGFGENSVLYSANYANTAAAVAAILNIPTEAIHEASLPDGTDVTVVLINQLELVGD